MTGIRSAHIFTLLFSCMFLFIAGCSTMQTIDISKRSQKYETDYLSAFKAVIAYCNERNYPIAMADKELGIVNTDYGSDQIDNSRLKVNFSLKKLSDTKTNIVIIVSDEKKLPIVESAATRIYKRIFDGVQSQIGK